MARIEIQDLTVSFPVFTGRGRSLKNALLRRSVGGDITSDDSHVTVVRALNGASVSLTEGDRLALLGRNGSGKTTLLRVMSGIYPPTRGSVAIHGSVASMTDLMMGMDLEESGYENIKLRSIFLGLRKAQQEALIVDVEEFTELGDFLSLPIRTYSQGMLLRLCFAISTALRPDIVVMDEVIGVGDIAFFNKAETRLNQMFESAGILVLASHDTTSVRRFCNRAILLEGGRIVAEGPPEEVLAVQEQRSV